MALRPIPAFVALLAALLVAWGRSSLHAATAPQVDNPHGRFHEECSLCHGANGWKPARISSKFDHGKYGFALAGAHSAAGCRACHTSLEFADSKTQCASCHKDPHRGEMGTDCARCHGARSFTDRGPMVRMHELTRFPLTGAHASIDCESCHKGAGQGQMQFVGTDAECKSCHMAQYQTAKNPDHVAGSYPLECRTCHGSTTWNGARFDHSGFPLTAGHAGLQCAQCHSDNVYKGKSTDCQSCHMTQYNGATPAHPAAGFAASVCASCHNTTHWSGATFDHNTNTSFPLTGAHAASTNCNDCHSSGVYKGLATDCLSCHQTEFNAAAPRHDTTNFPDTQCASCHTTSVWNTGKFNHSATAYPLTGSHATTATCAGCHSINNYAYKSTPTDCASCHMTQYNAATPNHVAQGFSASACATCHPITVWADGAFNHNPPATTFALTGAHVSPPAACSDCHSDGVYKGKPTNCLSCHQTDYNASVPLHNLTDFPDAQCATCHTTTAWLGGKITSHSTYFPTTHHTNTCTDCHVNTSNYMDNTCTATPGCHKKSSMDSEHSGRSGYSASAPDMQCVNPGCHRGGGGG